jgi:hypothetical protein
MSRPISSRNATIRTSYIDTRICHHTICSEQQRFICCPVEKQREQIDYPVLHGRKTLRAIRNPARTERI